MGAVAANMDLDAGAIRHAREGRVMCGQYQKRGPAYWLRRVAELLAEHPGDEIELDDRHESPVEAADDQQD